MNNDKLSMHGLQFEPSIATKQLALSVRHADYRAGGLKAPGLFGISALAADSMFLAVAVLLELLGFGAMFLFANASLVLLGLGIVFDIALGLFAHWPVGKLCLLENEELAACSRNRQEHFAVQARFYRRLRMLGATAIWCFAMIKSYLPVSGLRIPRPHLGGLDVLLRAHGPHPPALHRLRRGRLEAARGAES